MKKITVILLFLCLSQITDAQQWAKLSILQRQLQNSRPDTGRVNILLRIAEFHIFKPGRRKINIDSAAIYIDKADLLASSLKSVEATAYLTIVKSYLADHRGDLKTGEILIQNAIKQLSGTNNNYLLGKAYASLAGYVGHSGTIKFTTKYLIQKAADYYKSGRYFQDEALCHEMLAQIPPRDNETSFKEVYKELSIYKSINFKGLQIPYSILGEDYLAEGNYEAGLKWFLAALKVGHEQGDEERKLWDIERHLGNIYVEIGDFENGTRYLRMAVNSAKLNANSTTLLTIGSLVNLYLKLNQPSKAAEISKTISEAELYKSTTRDDWADFYGHQVEIYDMLNNSLQSDKFTLKLEHAVKDSSLDPGASEPGYRILTAHYLQRKKICRCNTLFEDQ